MKLIEFGFTKKEIDVINLIMKGYPDKQIAEELSNTIKTIKSHTANIYEKAMNLEYTDCKTNVKLRTKFILWCYQNFEDFGAKNRCLTTSPNYVIVTQDG